MSHSPLANITVSNLSLRVAGWLINVAQPQSHHTSQGRTCGPLRDVGVRHCLRFVIP